MKKILEVFKEFFRALLYPIYSEESHSECRYEIQEEIEKAHHI